METRCYRKILHVLYKDYVTNEEVHAKIQQAIGPHEDLLTIVKRRKLQWYGHVSRSSVLAKTTLQGTVNGEEDKADTSGNGQAWNSASPRGQWNNKKMEKTGCKIICSAPTTPAVKGLMMIMMMMMMMMIRVLYGASTPEVREAIGSSPFLPSRVCNWLII